MGGEQQPKAARNVSPSPLSIIFGGNYMNNCLCNLFDDNIVWIIIIALLLLCCCCG